MKMKKFIIAFIALIMMFVVCPQQVQASGDGFTFPTWDQLKQESDNFLAQGENNNLGESQMQSIFLPMAKILLSAGIIVLVAVTMIMGIKYMFASPEEAAKLKQQLIGLVVSAIVIFGAVGIWTLAYQVLSGVL